MLKARKANRVLKIPDEKKKTYIAMGYTITDMDGNMIHEHVEPSEKLAAAEKEIEDLKAQLVKASETVDTYMKKNSDLKAKLEAAEKKIEELESANAPGSVSEQASTSEGEPAVTDPDPESKTKKTTKASSKAEK